MESPSVTVPHRAYPPQSLAQIGAEAGAVLGEAWVQALGLVGIARPKGRARIETGRVRIATHVQQKETNG
jgi:hypothetical protein